MNRCRRCGTYIEFGAEVCDKCELELAALRSPARSTQRVQQPTQDSVRAVQMGCAFWLMLLVVIGFGILAAFRTATFGQFFAALGIAVGAGILLHSGLAGAFTDPGFGWSSDNWMFPIGFSSWQGCLGSLLGIAGIALMTLDFAYLSTLNLHTAVAPFAEWDSLWLLPAGSSLFVVTYYLIRWMTKTR